MDIEENMVHEAMTNLKDKGIENLNARVGDLCDIKLDAEFDVIIVPRESIQLLAPDSAKIAIANLSDHLLRKTGVLIIDVATFFCNSDPDYFSLNADNGWQENWSRVISNKHLLKRWSKQIMQDDTINFLSSL